MPVAPPVPGAPPVLRVVRPDDDVRDVDLRAAGARRRQRAADAPAHVGLGEGARRAAGSRASVPDWADVLLGTAPARAPERGETPESS